MENKELINDYILNGKLVTILSQLESQEETETHSAVGNLSYKIEKTILKKGNSEMLLEFIEDLDRLKKYIDFVNHPIHLNEFKDKYGNVYIQARTSIKVNDKTKWISAYVGAMSDYHKGLEDPLALKKGQILVRKKLQEFYFK